MFKLLSGFQAPPPGSAASLTEAEKKEKVALEKKLSEMEEELKVLLQFSSLRCVNISDFSS
jgi:hypothetical protein